MDDILPAISVVYMYIVTHTQCTSMLLGTYRICRWIFAFKRCMVYFLYFLCAIIQYTRSRCATMFQLKRILTVKCSSLIAGLLSVEILVIMPNNT